MTTQYLLKTDEPPGQTDDQTLPLYAPEPLPAPEPEFVDVEKTSLNGERSETISTILSSAYFGLPADPVAFTSAALLRSLGVRKNGKHYDDLGDCMKRMTRLQEIRQLQDELRAATPDADAWVPLQLDQIAVQTLNADIAGESRCSPSKSSIYSP